MRIISDILVSRSKNPVHTGPGPGDLGSPLSIKTTPRTSRVPQAELELMWMHNAVVFNGINKIVETIMASGYKIVAKNKKIQKYFENFVNNIGNSGSDLTWDELLAQIFTHECIFGWAWVENIFNKQGNRIVDWDLIDPKKMDYAKDHNQNIVLDKFGNPVGYFEKVGIGDTSYLPGQEEKLQKLPERVSDPQGYRWIYLEPKNIALMKLFETGDGFYPIGLIEPIYQTSLRKLNIEDALASAIYRHGFPIIWAQIGDSNHEPTPQHIESMLQKLREISSKQEIATPYFYDLKIIESKKFDKMSESLEYYINQEVTGLGIPKPFATGGGEATNRATLGNQTALFQLTLNDIIRRTTSAIEKYMFRPMAELEGFEEVPKIKWNVVGVDEKDKKSKRILQWVKSGVLDPNAKLADFIRQIEDLEPGVGDNPDPMDDKDDPDKLVSKGIADKKNKKIKDLNIGAEE